MIASIALFDKKLQQMKNVNSSAKDEIISTATTIFRNVVEFEDFNLEKQINAYTSEIYQVVKNHSADEEACKNYIRFVLEKIASGKNKE